jgi:aryl-alcohol dehydrogenase-like predicted oxidoreductase
MQFAGGRGFLKAAYPLISQDEMNQIIRAAWAGGINWFDTAEIYGRGRSEQGLASALKANRIQERDVFIATKWWPMFRTARGISRTISRRKHYLSPYRIGLYQVHQPISFSSPEAEMNAMADLVEKGDIAAVGVSNFDAIRMRRAHEALKSRGLTLASNQVKYSLLNRKIETNGILETAKEFSITIIAWGPLDSGLISGKFHKDPDILETRPFYRRLRLKSQLQESRLLVQELAEIAQAHGVTSAQVALSWLINDQKESVVAIPGASHPEQAQQNAAAMNLRLTGKEMTRIDELSRRFR